MTEEIDHKRPKKTSDVKKEDFKQIDLENIQVYNEPPEITEVRKKKVEEWKKKDEENKKKIQNDKARQEETTEYTKKQKDFERKNVTADSNGMPIYIKGVQYGLVGDFIMTKIDVKDKEQIFVRTEKSENAKEIVQTKKDEKINIPLINNPKDASFLKKDDKRGTRMGPIAERSILKMEIRDNKDVSRPNIGYAENKAPGIILQPAGSNYE